MSPKPDVSEERKHQILEAATRVFSDSGFNKARMDDIAEESGLSKGALYWYFKSKDEIIRGIFNRLIRREFDQYRKKQVPGMSAVDQVKLMVDIFLQDVNRMKPFMPIFFEYMAMGYRKKTYRGLFTHLINEFTKITTEILEAGIASGELIEHDPHKTAMAIGSLFEGSIIMWAYDPDHIDLGELVKSNFEIFLNGIERKKGE